MANMPKRGTPMCCIRQIDPPYISTAILWVAIFTHMCLIRLARDNPGLWKWNTNTKHPIVSCQHCYGITSTVETLYNSVNFCWSTHKRHAIARPKGRGMGCLLWVQRATYFVAQCRYNRAVISTVPIQNDQFPSKILRNLPNGIGKSD